MSDNTPAASNEKSPIYGSDVIVDILREYGIRYVALNPGSSFRGLHDSIVNHGGNHDPQIVLCPHEETSVAIAHGYAKATGEPMAVICHDMVGLMHATMAIYNSYADRVPIMVLGGTGPMDTEKRRPWIDWIHTALVQGNIVRGFVKWDDQPTSVKGFDSSFARGYTIATTEPQGPVYICYDAELQESKIEEKPSITKAVEPSMIQGDLDKIPEIGDSLLQAESPIIVAGRLGRNKKSIDHLIELSDVCSVGVIDTLERFNFPNTNCLDLTGTKLLETSDFILSLDTRNVLAGAQVCNARMGLKNDEAVKKLRHDSKIVSVGLDHLSNSSLVGDNLEFQKNQLLIPADTSLYIPHLVSYCRKKKSENSGLKSKLNERAARFNDIRESVRKNWIQQANASYGNSNHITHALLALEVWKVIKGRDWSLANGTIGGWARRLWDWSEPHNFYGDSGGAGLGYAIGASIGIALACRGSDRLVICSTGDGDFLMACNGIWTAAHEKIPLVFLIVNNRSYHNDLEHQLRVARHRQRPMENAKIGISLDDPSPDFSKLARSLGCTSPGTVESPHDLSSALDESIRSVTVDHKPAVVDVLVSQD